jgi:hypothetical protein
MTDANRAYQKYQKACRVAVARITAALDAHAARQAAEPRYWSYVGDVKQARLDLLRVAALLGDEQASETLHAEGDRP